MITLQMPKIIISPKNKITQGVSVSGFITANSHTMLQISGISMLDLSLLAQIGALNNTIHNNAAVINLNLFDFSIID